MSVKRRIRRVQISLRLLPTPPQASTLFKMSDDLEGQSSAHLRLGELMRESDPAAAKIHLKEVSNQQIRS
jgi:hypothetical protein